MKRSLNDLTAKQLEKVLDKWFSLFIRARDSDENGYIFCCTCRLIIIWRAIGGAECGHYSKRNKAHRFNEQNCHGQCPRCNSDKGGKGEADLHAIHIDKLHGKGKAQELRESENILIKKPREWYLIKIEHYKKEYKKLVIKKQLEV